MSFRLKNNKQAQDYRTFSGCDITPVVYSAGKLKTLGNVRTLSYSTHREVIPVRAMGTVYPKQHLRQNRTIAGTIVFTAFDTGVLKEITQYWKYDRAVNQRHRTMMIDQIPPFDIILTFTNEYGHMAYMSIYGVTISDEGQTHSVDDLYTETVCQYTALDMDRMVAAEEDDWTTKRFDDAIFYGRYDIMGSQATFEFRDGTTKKTYMSNLMAQVQEAKREKARLTKKLLNVSEGDTAGMLSAVGIRRYMKNKIEDLDNVISNMQKATTESLAKIDTIDVTKSYHSTPFDYSRIISVETPTARMRPDDPDWDFKRCPWGMIYNDEKGKCIPFYSMQEGANEVSVRANSDKMLQRYINERAKEQAAEYVEDTFVENYQPSYDIPPLAGDRFYEYWDKIDALRKMNTGMNLPPEEAFGGHYENFHAELIRRLKDLSDDIDNDNKLESNEKTTLNNKLRQALDEVGGNLPEKSPEKKTLSEMYQEKFGEKGWGPGTEGDDAEETSPDSLTEYYHEKYEDRRWPGGG